MDVPKPGPKPIHPSHKMKLHPQGFRRCWECDRCTCCRPLGLKVPCPAPVIIHIPERTTT